MGPPASAARPHYPFCGGFGDQRVGDHGARRGLAGRRPDLRPASKAAKDGRRRSVRSFPLRHGAGPRVRNRARRAEGGTQANPLDVVRLSAVARARTILDGDLFRHPLHRRGPGYLGHPVLAERLARSVDAVLGISGRSAHAIFGSPDDLKFRSSMTLFSQAGGKEGERFRRALHRFFAGEPDRRTLELMDSEIR